MTREKRPLVPSAEPLSVALHDGGHRHLRANGKVKKKCICRSPITCAVTSAYENEGLIVKVANVERSSAKRIRGGNRRESYGSGTLYVSIVEGRDEWERIGRSDSGSRANGRDGSQSYGRGRKPCGKTEVDLRKSGHPSDRRSDDGSEGHVGQHKLQGTKPRRAEGRKAEGTEGHPSGLAAQKVRDSGESSVSARRLCVKP